MPITNLRPSTAVLLIAFLAAPRARGLAQRDPTHSYISLRAGPAIQQKDDAFDARNRFGVSAGVAAGRPLDRWLLAEGEVSGAWFGAQPVESPPLPPGVTSTAASENGPVDLLMAAANAVYVDDPERPGSNVLVGVGLSRFYAHPVHPGAIRPFVQMGVGARWPREGGGQFIVEARWQQFPGAYAPRWLVPITLELRW